MNRVLAGETVGWGDVAATLVPCVALTAAGLAFVARRLVEPPA